MTSKKEQSQLRIRDREWWMRRRQLPLQLRQRVCKYERQKWAATRGIDEEATVQDLPEGLRRDIKRHLCLDLVRQVTWLSYPSLQYRITYFISNKKGLGFVSFLTKLFLSTVQVPLFQQMDDLVLNNICERLKPGLFIKDETVGALTQKLIVIDWCVLIVPWHFYWRGCLGVVQWESRIGNSTYISFWLFIHVLYSTCALLLALSAFV